MPEDVEGLLKELMAELRLVREENARILQRLEEEALLAKRQAVQDGERLRLLRVSEIAFITTKDDGVTIHGADGRRYLAFEGIGEVWKRHEADRRLMRTHKSYIVNLDQVRAVDNVEAGREVLFYGWPDETLARVTNESAAEFDRRLGHA